MRHFILLAWLLLTAAAPIAPPVTVEPTPAAAPNCAVRREARSSELCAQWRAADAAVDSLIWNRAQVLLNLAGLIGLFLTLYFTRRATRAAEAATQGSEEALEIARRNAQAATDAALATNRSAEAFMSAERARLVMWAAQGTSLDEGRSQSIRIQIENIGRSTAFIEKIEWTSSQDGMVPEVFDRSERLNVMVRDGQADYHFDATIRGIDTRLSARLTYRTTFGTTAITYGHWGINVVEDRGNGLITMWDRWAFDARGEGWPADT